jgi:beta-glucanase (GH16 family)
MDSSLATSKKSTGANLVYYTQKNSQSPQMENRRYFKTIQIPNNIYPQIQPYRKY